MKKIVLPLLLFFLVKLKVYAQDMRNALELKVDNDVYIAFKQDRYYTNGTFLNYRFASQQQNLKKSKLQKKTYEVELGQKIYTAYTQKFIRKDPHDRPYTGYLYTGLVINKFYKNESLFKYGFKIGATGKKSFADKVQTSFHEYLNLYKIKGWENQLNGEISVNVNASYNKLLYRPKNKLFDFTGIIGGQLGNAFSGAHLGTFFRFGKLNKIYSSSAFKSWVSNNSSNRNKKNELYFSIKPLINFVAYDSSIQGGLFLKDKGPVSFDVKRFVFSGLAGLTYSVNRFAINYCVTFKSKEVKSPATAYYYGSISLIYRAGKISD